MKTLIFGAGGLLGRYLAKEFVSAGHDVVALTRAQADITDSRKIDDLFAGPWDVVINAAAICDFDACERDPEGTARVNRDAPLSLAQHCAARGALFVQYSSDYIFDGSSREPLAESDLPAPLSVYGHQKADLENLVPALGPRHLILRLSWLYGIGGKTFMSQMPSLLSTRKSLRTAAGKKGSCLYAADGALWTRRLVESGRTGLFNLVNAGETSWEEFAETCLEKMRLAGLRPECGLIDKIPYEDLGPGWRKRPRYSCLDIARLATALPPGPRAWTDALDDFLTEWKSVAAQGRV